MTYWAPFTELAPGFRIVTSGRFQLEEKAEGLLNVRLTLLSSFTDVEGAVSVNTLQPFHAVTVVINSLEFLCKYLFCTLGDRVGLTMQVAIHKPHDRGRSRPLLYILEPSWLEESRPTFVQTDIMKGESRKFLDVQSAQFPNGKNTVSGIAYTTILTFDVIERFVR
jgi:hypothetical protein